MNKFITNNTTVILANGAFPTGKIPLQILKASNKIICCDGAINKLHKTGLKPFAIVGDLDSISQELKIKYKDILHHVPDQETNDLTKAVNWCFTHNLKDIIILGATGEREDHALANIFLILQYAQKMNVAIVTNYGRFLPILRSKTIKSFKGQQISIFSTNPNTNITTSNLKYPLKNQPLKQLWQGTLNESLSDTFTLKFKDSVLIIYLKN